MKPILVVFAAGMGSRYGSLKQMDRIGREGEVLLHFSVYDAVRAGFERVVFVIRRAIEKDFTEVVLKRLPKELKYSLAFQEIDTLIPEELFAQAKANGREQPWGTAHALICASEQLDAPFLVINADDFYGREAFSVMAQFLSEDNQKNGAVATYSLGKTLKTAGGVTRRVCAFKDGLLTSVDETPNIEKKGNLIISTFADGRKKQLLPAAPVSMKFWGFPLSALDSIKFFFYEYLKQLILTRKHECYIPLAVDWLVKNHRLSIRQLKTASEWFGITWFEDRQNAIARIMDLNSKGVYPAPLWEGAR